MTFEKISSFYCCIQRSFHSRYIYRFYHSRATRTWSVCNEMNHDVFRYEYLTFQTQIHLHKQYIFDTNILQSEYAFLFPFSIYLRRYHTYAGVLVRQHVVFEAIILLANCTLLVDYFLCSYLEAFVKTFCSPYPQRVVKGD